MFLFECWSSRRSRSSLNPDLTRYTRSYYTRYTNEVLLQSFFRTQLNLDQLYINSFICKLINVQHAKFTWLSFASVERIPTSLIKTITQPQICLTSENHNLCITYFDTIVLSFKGHKSVITNLHRWLINVFLVLIEKLNIKYEAE